MAGKGLISLDYNIAVCIPNNTYILDKGVSFSADTKEPVNELRLVLEFTEAKIAEIYLVCSNVDIEIYGNEPKSKDKTFEFRRRCDRTKEEQEQPDYKINNKYINSL